MLLTANCIPDLRTIAIYHVLSYLEMHETNLFFKEKRDHTKLKQKHLREIHTSAIIKYSMHTKMNIHN